MARMNYKCLRVDPEIKVIVKTIPKYENGEFVGADRTETKYQTGVATDGTKFQGFPVEYFFTCEPGYVNAGDVISADTTQGMDIQNVLVEHGANVAAPLRPEAPPVRPAFNPNDTGDAPYATPNGILTNRDINELFQAQQKTIESLSARIRVLEIMLPKHCQRCRGCLVAEEQGSFRS